MVRVIAHSVPLRVAAVCGFLAGLVESSVVGFLALLPFYGRLQETDRVWWLWTCQAGFWLGVLLAALCVGVIGALTEWLILRRIYRAPELFQLLGTFARAG